MIAHTKLQIPQSRLKVVPRPHLMNKLDLGMKTKLTLLSAQAGYGKTTTLVEWAKREDRQVIWISLEPRDNDWSAFWGCVIAAIQEKISGFGASLGFLLEQSSEGSFESGISAFLNEWRLVSNDWVLIWDDYHVIDHPIVQQSVAYMLGYLPAHVHLYIASRTDLPFPIARLTAKGEFNLIHTQDLRFGMEEGITFFRDTMDLILTNEQIAALHAHTEGWVSGLQLAAITLAQSGDIAASIRRFNGNQRQISDYLLEEVFVQQSEEMKQFLLATSSLTRMNGSVCQAVTERADSQEILETLERLNLFIIPLDEERQWYRYHHLLSDFLQRVAREEDSERWMEHHSRAANWCEQNGLHEEAVEHFLQARQAEDAIRLIEQHLTSFIFSKSAVLLNWIKAMPEASYANKPSIEMFYISMLIKLAEWKQAVGRAKKAEIRFQSLRNELTDHEWRQVMGNLYYFSGIIAYFQQDFSLASHYFEQLNECLPEGSFFQNVGSNRYVGYDQFNDLLSFTNDLPGVEAFLIKWINNWRGHQHYPFVGFQYVTYCMLLYECNRLDEARHYLREAMEREDLRSYVWIGVQLNILSSLLAQAQGNHTSALRGLEQATEIAYSPDYPVIEQKIASERARLYMRQGLLDSAMDWCRSCGLSHTDEVSRYRLSEYLDLARVLAASGQSDAAMELLDKIHHFVQQDDRKRDRIRLLILHSIISWNLGDTDNALIRLNRALSLARPSGYVRSFLDEGATMRDMLSALSKRLGDDDEEESLGVGTYILELLDAGQIPSSTAESKNQLLTAQETKVLHLMYEGMQLKEIAGCLHVTKETVKYHTKNIYRKLDVHNRAQAFKRAKELGIPL
ncbi:LuxR C-terminal-related transcriptional regulator [Paenibacillus sp. strain BS8-2]